MKDVSVLVIFDTCIRHELKQPQPGAVPAVSVCLYLANGRRANAHFNAILHVTVAVRRGINSFHNPA